MSLVQAERARHLCPLVSLSRAFFFYSYARLWPGVGNDDVIPT